jgi:YfiH family protein
MVFLDYLNQIKWRSSLEQQINVFADVSCVVNACFEGKFGKVLSCDSPVQVHGTKWVSPKSGNADIKQEGDAIFTTGSNAVGVVTADCLPLLFVNPEEKTCGAVHVGWRGLTAGILNSSPPEAQFASGDTLVALGPCIGLSSFEVGPEVLAEFQTKFSSKMGKSFWLGVSKGKEDRWHLDLQVYAAFELYELGICAKNIEVHQVDTVTQNHHWFSYRCENPTGRNVACIQLRK